MSVSNPVPKLITFDGEARSGKGTIVQATKDALRDQYGHHVMLIDAGQVFRCLVVAAARDGVNLDDSDAIDAFLGDDAKAEACVHFVKDVYHMSKSDRDSLLYTNKVGADSAKIGARPLSQAFKDELLKKWLRDARLEGFDVVLLDGRALEETGMMLESEGLCDFVMGLYFICDPIVGAMRTLGFANRAYDELSPTQSKGVNELIEQIKARNKADAERAVQPIIPPKNAPQLILPDVGEITLGSGRFMATVDTSARMKKSQMSVPIISIAAEVLTR